MVRLSLFETKKSRFAPSRIGETSNPLMKWDMIFNLLFITAFVWVYNQPVLAIWIFIQIFIFSFFSFNYRGLSVSLLFLILSGIPFWLYISNPQRNGADIILFVGVILAVYGVFWIFIALKNNKAYLDSLKPQTCPICETEKHEFVQHLGRFMCTDCFYKEAFEVVEHDGIEIFKWDYNFLKFLENQIEKPIPLYKSTDRDEIDWEKLPEEEFFGYIIDEKNIKALSLPNAGIKAIPNEIGLLTHIKFLNLQGNQLVDLPLSIERIASLRYLNIQRNIMEIISQDLEYVFRFLKKRKCVILE
ncbi:hypothetical protein [Candidatus Lokiarchaeum ossiferum]|uniref:hypothetical protein n=1 Tax=Candidatus Lokiarchaeum ossiferum TaxID=2951803 RepID=UPI00352F308D